MIFFVFSVILVVIALLCLIHPSKDDIAKLQQQLRRKPQTIKQMSRKKESRLKEYVKSLQKMIRATNRESTLVSYLIAAVALAAAGFLIGILMGNDFLAPVLAAIGFFIPFLKIKFDFVHYRQFVVNELESTLSAITTSFERTENIQLSISENLAYIPPPLNDFFSQFLFRMEHVDPDVEAAIDELKASIDHSVFREWCDALKRCVSNRNLIFTLQPIVDKFSEIKIVICDIKNSLYRVLREYWSLVVLSCILTAISIFGIPIMLHIAIPDIVAQIIVAVNVFAISLTSIKVILEASDVQTDI